MNRLGLEGGSGPIATTGEPHMCSVQPHRAQVQDVSVLQGRRRGGQIKGLRGIRSRQFISLIDQEGVNKRNQIKGISQCNTVKYVYTCKIIYFILFMYIAM